MHKGFWWGNQKARARSADVIGGEMKTSKWNFEKYGGWWRVRGLNSCGSGLC